MIKKSILSIVLLIVSFGCAPKQPLVYNYDFTKVTPAFTISDERPAPEKKAEILSVNILNDNYGIFRIGDNETVPDRIQYLTNQLGNKANSQLSGKQVVVKHFEIHNNLQKILKRGATFGTFGLVGGVLAGVTKNPDALIDIKLALTIDQKQHDVHLVRGYKLPSGKDENQVATEIYQGIDEAIDRIVTDF